MRFVFRISSRIRCGAPIPRDFGVIPGLEHLGLVHKSRIVETPEDFNATLAMLSDPRFPNRGATFQPYALTAEDEKKTRVELPPEPVEQTASTYNFRRDGDDIFMGDERVGGIYENGLRCSKGYAHLRESLEAWLNSQPE